jgi:ribosomal protein L1
MNEEHFNLEIRKFLKTVGVTAQREIEKSVREALASGALSGDEALEVAVRLEIDGVGLSLPIDGTIELEPK